MGPSKLEQAEATMAAQRKQAPGAKAEEAETKEIPAPIPVKVPDYLEDMGFCRVGVTVNGLDGRNQIVVIDPGFKKVQHMDGWSSDDPEVVAKAYAAIARSIQQMKIPALLDFEELGVIAGQEVPLPKEFLREHINQWEEWRKIRLEVERKNLEARAVTPDGQTFIPTLVPDPPETKLQILLSEAIPSLVFLRIIRGLGHAVNPDQGDTGEGN